MLSTLLRSSLGRPALASLRGRTISTSSAMSSSSSFSRAYPILLGRGLVSANNGAYPMLGARIISTTTTLGEPAAAKATKEAKTKKTTTAKKTTKSSAEKKVATAKKKVGITKKGKAPTAKKVKAVKPKVLKKKKVEPKVRKIMKKDLKPPFPPPKTSWLAFATKRFAELKTTGQSNMLGDYLGTISEEWHRLDKATQNTYNAPKEEYEVYRKRKEEWRAGLEPRLKRALKKKFERGPLTAPASAFAEFVKERFASTQYPEDVVSAPQKMKFLSEAYRVQVDPAEKEALRQRALDSLERKKLQKAEAAQVNSQTNDVVV